jgi:hypothetical protein
MRRMLLALALCAAGVLPAAADPHRFDAPAGVVAFGDVHGAHAALVDTLRAAGVVDAQQRWIAGERHLVSVGDLVDRGADSRRVLDLLMRLEGEAAAAGGRVHVLMGNHELMNLLGELRDLAPGEIAAFAVDETEAQRSAAFAGWLSRQPAGTDATAARAAFDARFPPGWFARRAAFAPQGRYGAWLLARPLAVAVGDTVFVHGGISSTFADWPLDRLNRTFAERLVRQLDDIAALEAAGWIAFEQTGESRPEVLAARIASLPADADPALAEAARRVVAWEREALPGIRGPMWYRGLALCRPVLEQDVVDAAVARHGVARIAMGHTVAPRLHPTLRLDGRALQLDTGMLRSVYRGFGNAVTIEQGKLAVVREDGQRAAPWTDPVAVLPRAPGGDEAAFALRLAQADWVAAPPDPAAASAVQLDFGGQPLPAAWMPGGRRGEHRRELAAWRLDRLLGLGLVPTTVERTVGGETGAVQWRPQPSIPAADAARGAAGGSPWCDTEAQVELLYVWDALIGNPARSEASLAWTREDWLLLASDHRAAFETSSRLPQWLADRPLRVGPTLCRRLAALDASGLEAALGTLLEPRRRSALLARRDRILNAAGCPGG